MNRINDFRLQYLSAVINIQKISSGCPRGVSVKAMDCGIVVCEFVLQSRYYVHFRANTHRKDMNHLILPGMGQIVPLLFFEENGFGFNNLQRVICH